MSQRGDVSWKTYSDQWKANHGTLLMSFAAGVFLVGVAILAYQQNRFQPPAFPSADAIKQTAGVDEVATTTVSAETPSFQLRIIGGAETAGQINVAIYSAEENFNDPDVADWKQSIAVDETGAGEVNIPVEAVGEKFAIAVYQDVNLNGELDRNALGIPTERYGFSNAARGTVGPPSFEQALIDRPQVGDGLEIKIW
ncbi:DUF2141 domain-containing protein [Aporhodopirellula aestuarii]|uniref:DUF2141 domain-containing protein n=1 Tax=Aporhodopirellula aestuarii TaxID=2950107 RepID=A0ABT0U282_9BACT|nr:DUF2141 domain-containing protein [Aporhodopirellula aestuarii]MCM2370598.1 DUF2141 domain-containing protein [Aporhodopirellula aestuarii]